MDKLLGGQSRRSVLGILVTALGGLVGIRHARAATATSGDIRYRYVHRRNDGYTFESAFSYASYDEAKANSQRQIARSPGFLEEVDITCWMRISP